MAIPRRSLQDIRMEKARKTLESEKARQMMADIAARLAEIEAEKASLLQSMGEGGKDATLARTGPRRSTGGFKIKY
jgi:CHASE3 domain sensor protein